MLFTQERVKQVIYIYSYIYACILNGRKFQVILSEAGHRLF